MQPIPNIIIRVQPFATENSPLRTIAALNTHKNWIIDGKVLIDPISDEAKRIIVSRSDHIANLSNSRLLILTQVACWTSQQDSTRGFQTRCIVSGCHSGWWSRLQSTVTSNTSYLYHTSLQSAQVLDGNADMYIHVTKIKKWGLRVIHPRVFIFTQP